ncbi:Autophagy protein 22 [Boothiomyces sp. JEL0866]|nr:Autophagy protein 22 [Boothiomyces sp. JEL0866]
MSEDKDIIESFDAQELDNSPISRKEVLGFYSFGIAAEPYSGLGISVFFPLLLQTLANDNAVQTSNLSLPCNTTANDPCSINVGFYVDTASIVFYSTSISVLLQFILFITLGSLADHGNYRKGFLMFFSITTSILGLLLLTVVHNSLWWIAFLVYIISNTTYGASFVFYYAWVPIMTRFDAQVMACEADADLTEGERFGVSDKAGNEVSGKGFLFSYVSSVCMLILGSGVALAMGSGENYGLPSVYPLIVGVAMVSLYQLVILLIFTSRYLKPRPVWGSVRDASQITELFKFLVAWFIYSDSFSTCTSVAILYGQVQLGASTTILLISGIICPLVAGIGNFVWLHVQKKFRWTTKKVLLVQASMFSLLPLYGLVGFFTPRGSFGLQSVIEIPILAAYLGFILGATQSTCRVFFSELLPRGHESEFFALYELTDKGSSWVGPLIVGLITQLTGNIRYGFIFLFFAFFIPIYVFSRVDPIKGKIQAMNFQKSFRVHPTC